MKPTGFMYDMRKQETAVDHVLNAVINSIINEELHPGDKLPTEPELSQQLGVGRNTVREAIKILIAYGLVSINRPGGTYINDSYNEKMLNPMIYNILLQKSDWQDLINLRGVLEIGTLFQACNFLQDEDIEDLTAIVDELEREISKKHPSIDSIIDCDSHFHSRIVKITGSRLILDVTEYITRFTIPSRKRTTEMVLKKKETDSFIQKHREIITVLSNRNYAAIEKVVLSHYEYWKETE